MYHGRKHLHGHQRLGGLVEDSILTQEIPTKTTEEETGKEETHLKKSQCPRNGGRARQKQSKQMKGQLRQGPRRGKEYYAVSPRTIEIG
jgi:hypothetical protein